MEQRAARKIFDYLQTGLKFPRFRTLGEERKKALCVTFCTVRGKQTGGGGGKERKEFNNTLHLLLTRAESVRRGERTVQ